MIFQDRADAGKKLAARLKHYQDTPRGVVLALPRGGVPVGFEVACELGLPLDIFLVRKLGVPGHEELGMGAIASGGIRILNDEVIRSLSISTEDIEKVTAVEQVELERRERTYRGNRPPTEVHGATVILVDDGLATGSTMRAAVAAVRKHEPARIIVAVPVGSADTCSNLRREADEVVCAAIPRPFYAVGSWYANFEPTTDQEVHDLLVKAEELSAGETSQRFAKSRMPFVHAASEF